MQGTRELAKKITAAIFDHIERERTFNNERITGIVEDCLLLGKARGEHTVELSQAVKELGELMQREPDISFGAPVSLHRALTKFEKAWREAHP